MNDNNSTTNTILIILVVIVVGFIVWFVMARQRVDTTIPSTTTGSPSTEINVGTSSVNF